jgi:hypothetical protein
MRTEVIKEDGGYKEEGGHKKEGGHREAEILGGRRS